MLLTSIATRDHKRPLARGQCATATSVVLAIGQRVQDAVSFYAMTATIQEKQRAFVAARRQTAKLCKEEQEKATAIAPAELLRSAGRQGEGLGGAPFMASSPAANKLQSGSRDLSGYTTSMNEVGSGEPDVAQEHTKGLSDLFGVTKTPLFQDKGWLCGACGQDLTHAVHHTTATRCASCTLLR